MKAIRLIYGLLILCFAASCGHEHGEYGLYEKIEEEGKKYHGVDISSEAYIHDYETIEITEEGHTFLIPDRKSQIKSFACSECHSQPLNEMKYTDEIKQAHWDIKLNHANENTMNCVTCHTGKNMDDLHSLTDKPIDFNNSYKLCMQCHNNQYEDWLGGAHGKNIGGWAEPRAAMTCVNCHNPHKPQIPSKWPERFNSKKEKQRK
ncbi:MAG: nitrate/TMAO reductase-like tetraheme cytochrome c subunit [Parvicellaceae bacterium]|jgi:nitrate/TMAO reductase-like tetraheme cytochrome c subunit